MNAQWDYWQEPDTKLYRIREPMDGNRRIIGHVLREENARLIAAAPDLLEALKVIVADIHEYERINNLAPNPGRAECWDSVARAVAAIAKAEGREP